MSERGTDSETAGKAVPHFGGHELSSGAGARRPIFFLPLAVFVMLALVFAWGLTRDPRILPSALVGQPVPDFSLPPVQGRSLGLATEHLRGEVSLVNVWASWCVPCRREKPLFLELRRSGLVPIHGINHKDLPEQAAQFLQTHGDAYTRTGADLDGRVSLLWGVYGLPETFVVDKQGKIRFRHVGELTPAALGNTILPLVKELQEQ